MKTLNILYRKYSKKVKGGFQEAFDYEIFDGTTLKAQRKADILNKAHHYRTHLIELKSVPVNVKHLKMNLEGVSKDIALSKVVVRELLKIDPTLLEKAVGDRTGAEQSYFI